MIPFSILDLSPIPKGASAAVALRNTLELAQHAESLGYKRYWLAEHHNMPGIASAATSIVIGHVAGGTKTIRVGSGGIMLPNHSPLVIAEQFGTLASLYPGRIDLGLGRAPGTDMMTARALRRDMENSAEQFPQDVQELQNYFAATEPGQHIRAVPGAGLEVPIWLLGSSLFSAQLAAMLGLPFAFASHFAPDLMRQALEIYRSRFRAVQTTGPALRHAWRECARGRYGCASATPVHLAATIFHQSQARIAGPGAAADRRHRCLLVSRREGDGGTLSRRFVRGLCGYDFGRARPFHRFPETG